MPQRVTPRHRGKTETTNPLSISLLAGSGPAQTVTQTRSQMHPCHGIPCHMYTVELFLLPLVLSGPAAIQARQQLRYTCSGKRYQRKGKASPQVWERATAKRKGLDCCDVTEYIPPPFSLYPIFPFRSSTKKPHFRHIWQHSNKCSRQYNPLFHRQLHVIFLHKSLPVRETGYPLAFLFYRSSFLFNRSNETFTARPHIDFPFKPKNHPLHHQNGGEATSSV